jgi:oligopeptidase B
MFRIFKVILLLSVCLTSLTGCGDRAPQPPLAEIRPHEMTTHGHTRTDNYFWLREREDPQVLAYLEAENSYLEAMTREMRPLQDKLLAEMKGRIKQDDSSAPYLWQGYWYYTRYVEGGEYPLHCRRPGTMEGPEQVMFDGNALAGDGYFSLRGVQVSPDNRLATFAIDTEGRRFFDIGIKNLDTGKIYPDRIAGVTANVDWALDSKTLFYTRQDPETLRSYQIWRHELGTPQTEDVLVFEETDETFRVSVGRTKSDRYLVISSAQTQSTECRILEADNPTGTFRVFEPRRRDHEYDIDHQGDRWLITTNFWAPNFKLMECGLSSTDMAGWTEVVGHRDDVLLEYIEVFENWLVLAERHEGLRHLKVLPMDGSPAHTIDFGEPTWAVYPAINPTMKTDELRFSYSSLTVPDAEFAYDLKTRERTLLKQDEVLGGFSSADYQAEYVRVPARDGTLVPVSLVYRKGTKRDGTSPLLLYAYGSYGYSMEASFSSNRLSLLDRGFVYAIAHVRGGQEMGRSWYEDGKLLKKMNTFTDFIDCAHHLVNQGYTSSDRLFAMGGSAGGLLAGAIMNLEPELWKGVVAQVPFVDVVTTMLDETIPLTTFEYDEWGNPGVKEYYDYMLSYSPYDQVEAKAYPALLVTTGLHDSQVQYWEPAKWVAKLRALKTDDHPLLMHINMEAGHGGASGRFRRLEETALGFAFICDLAGIKD